MFKFLSFVFALVLFVMVFAPQTYFDIFASTKGLQPGNDWSEQLAYGFASALFSESIVSRHMPYVLIGLVISVGLWISGADKPAEDFKPGLTKSGNFKSGRLIK